MKKINLRKCCEDKLYLQITNIGYLVYLSHMMQH